MRFVSSIPLAAAMVLVLSGCEGIDFGPITDWIGRSDEDVRMEETGAADEATEVVPPASASDVPAASALGVPDAKEATLGGEGVFLGTTIASLGNPNDAGFWVKTPLVTQPTAGHVHYSASNRSVRVELIPSGGAAGSGSQISLPAMQLLDAPLGQLLELAVYQG